MKLKQYIKENGINVSWFAKKAKLHRLTITNAMNGKPINLETAIKIEKASEGKVTVHDLFSNG